MFSKPYNLQIAFYHNARDFLYSNVEGIMSAYGSFMCRKLLIISEIFTSTWIRKQSLKKA